MHVHTNESLADSFIPVDHKPVVPSSRGYLSCVPMYDPKKVAASSIHDSHDHDHVTWLGTKPVAAASSVIGITTCDKGSPNYRGIFDEDSIIKVPSIGYNIAWARVNIRKGKTHGKYPNDAISGVEVEHFQPWFRNGSMAFSAITQWVCLMLWRITRCYTKVHMRGPSWGSFATITVSGYD